MEKIEQHETNRESQYWAEFYEKNDFSEGSSFFEFINELPQMPGTIVDIGCGQGRDSFAFAKANTERQVIGLDRSDVGVENAINQTDNPNISFYQCDVSDSEDLIEKLNYARDISKTGDICYYMRFFLHSVPEDIQQSLMVTIAEHAQPGDVFTAEFRTDKDLETSKEFGDTHYRRYQSAEEFSYNLKTQHGWEDIVYEVEDTGLSPYKHEDPVLYRVIAIKS